MVELRHTFTQPSAHTLERRARRHRRMEVAALRSRKELDRHDVRAILRHRG
jgi:hypothetical protein